MIPSHILSLETVSYTQNLDSAFLPVRAWGSGSKILGTNFFALPVTGAKDPEIKPTRSDQNA
jgi:hypothetical protein